MLDRRVLTLGLQVLPDRPARERALLTARVESGTCHWTATFTSRVRPEPRTTNTFSVLIRNQKRKWKIWEACQTPVLTEIRSWGGQATTKTSSRSARRSGGSFTPNP